MNLDRDDLGRSNDTVQLTTGKKVTVRRNVEHVTIRGIIPGEYIVNVHLYRRVPRSEVLETDYFDQIPIIINIEKLNPYGLVYLKKVFLIRKGEEKTVVRFTVDEDGEITELNELPFQIVQSMGGLDSQGDN